MCRVGRDRQDEGFLLGAVEEADLDGVGAAQFGRPQAVHAVDDPHGVAVHEDRWQVVLDRSQHLDVADVLAGPPR